MQRAILSTIALYRHDPTLFDGFVVPAGMNKQDFIDRLLIEQGEQEVLYTNPDIMRRAIGAWSRGRLPMWQKLYDLQEYEYNPGWNVDGETWHDGTSESHGTTSGTSNETRTDGRTENRTYTRDRDQTDTFTENTSGTDDTVNQLSADNSQAWSNDTQSLNTKAGTRNSTDTIAEDITDTDAATISGNGSTTGGTSGKDDRTGAESWHERRQGNIGVTMTQQLLTADRELWESNDVQGFMINEYKKEFCIMVY